MSIRTERMQIVISKEMEMQMQKKHAGDLEIASLSFTHVDPSTGKFTAWTFALSESSLSVPCHLQSGGGSEDVIPPES